MDRPTGNTSEKAMPVRDTFPAAVLLIVKLKEDVVPFTIGLDKKDLVMVGAGVGMPHPVTTMLSRFIEAPLGFAPSALILIIVVLDPVLAAANV